MSISAIKEFIVKIKTFSSTYKWLLIPLIPMAFFLYAAIFWVVPLENPKVNPDITNQTVNPTKVPVAFNKSPTPVVAYNDISTPEVATNVVGTHDHEIIDPSEESRLLRTENLSDGSVRYTIRSARATRPHIRIAKGEEIVFKRVVIGSDFPLELSGFKSYFGDPEQVIKGSLHYGSDQELHIYAKQGFSLIVDPKTNQVLEQHIFTPMTVEEYIKQYGDDIPSNTRGSITPAL